MSDLEILFPDGKEILLQGKTFIIKPFTFGQMPKVLKVLQLAANQIEVLKLKGEAASPKVALTLIAECGEELIKLMADIMHVDVEFISNLEQDEAIQLMTDFFKVNSDFFTKRVAPLMAPLTEKK